MGTIVVLDVSGMEEEKAGRLSSHCAGAPLRGGRLPIVEPSKKPIEQSRKVDSMLRIFIILSAGLIEVEHLWYTPRG